MVRVQVRARPSAKRSAIVRFVDNVLWVDVAAQPIDSRANDALRELLAKELEIRPSSVTILHGHTSRIKLVEIDIAAERLQAMLDTLPR